MKITPELAAQVVKNYLLPMFDSDEKKYLRKKYKKLTDNKAVDDKDTEAEGEGSPKVADANPTSIFGELKLSSQLLDKIRHLETTISNLTEEMHSVMRTRDENFDHIKRLQKSLNISQLKESFHK